MLLRQILIGLVLIFSLTPILNAQIHGLSVSDTADPAGKGNMQIMGCTVQSENSSMYGGRFAYGISDRFLLFMDIGSYDHEKALKTETMGQFGLRYSLPVDLPFDLAVRSTIIPYIASYEHYVELTLSLLVSRYLDSDSNWGIYGSVGVDYQEWELEMSLDPVQAAMYGQDTYIDVGDQTDISFSLGFTRRLFGTTRLFIEAAHVKDFFGGAGIRFDL
ncbi:MAG: hypothetical protein GY863_17830 [bacterium]|nr:hypothetical protein [bacterium]